VILFIAASANRDERHFPDAERFDIHRSSLPAAYNAEAGFPAHGGLKLLTEIARTVGAGHQRGIACPR
jgi:cytochrome P450